MSYDVQAVGELARVRWVSTDRLTVVFDLRDGRSARVAATQPVSYSRGDVFLIDLAADNLEPVDASSWPEESYVATIVQATSDSIVAQVGSRLQILSADQKVEVKVGNSVELTDSGIIARILSEKPLDETRADLDIDAADTAAGIDLSYEDFGGYDDVKRRASELIEVPLRYQKELAAIGARPIKGVLFTGPPGTGKTMLARIIASQSGANFYPISGPEIFSKWYGQSEEILRRIFRKASTAGGRSIIFFDEIDSVAGHRTDESHEASKRVVAQLLTLMDGFTTEDNVIVVATTNRPDDIDVALRRPGRFDWEIPFTLPDLRARESILRTAANRLATSGPLPHDVAASVTDGWSGAELSAIWTEAALLAVIDRRRIIMLEDYMGGIERVAMQKARLKEPMANT